MEFMFSVDRTESRLPVSGIKLEDKDEQHGESSQRNCGTVAGKWLLIGAREGLKKEFLSVLWCFISCERAAGLI